MNTQLNTLSNNDVFNPLALGLAEDIHTASLYANEGFEPRWALCVKHGPYSTVVRPGLPPSRCRACVHDMVEKEKARFYKERRLQQLHDYRVIAKKSGIPERFKDLTLDSFKINGSKEQQTLDIACAYSTELGKPEITRRSMIFAGRSGTGKTHLACAIATQALRDGLDARYENVDRLFRHIKDGYSSSAKVRANKVFEQVIKADFLVLDALGQNPCSPADRKVLREVITERYDSCLPTLVVLTLGSIERANKKIQKAESETLEIEEEIELLLGERVMEILLQDGGRVMPFTWRTYREQVDMPADGLFAPL